MKLKLKSNPKTKFPKKLLTTISTITLSLSLLLTPILTSPTLASEVNTSPQVSNSNTISQTASTKTVKPTKVTLNKKTTTINIGSTETLTPTIFPSTATNQNVTWKSSNTRIATVDSGTVTGIKKGRVIITATTVDGKKKATCRVTVKSVPIPIILSISDIEQTINQGDDYSLPETIEVMMSDNSKKQLPITWKPSTVDTSIIGAYWFYGKVSGWSKDVKLTLIINSSPSEQTISSIADISKTINKNDSYSLPTTVEATMKDGSKKQVSVIWNTLNVDTSKSGIFIFYGNVQEYSKQVKLTLNILEKQQTIEEVQGLLVGNWVIPSYKIQLEFSNNGSLIQSYYYTTSWYSKEEIEYTVISPTEMKFDYIRWYDSNFDKWFISKDADKIFNFKVSGNELIIFNWSEYGKLTFKKW